jgi:antirestriction protein ArdC
MTTHQLRRQVNEAIIQALEQGSVPWRSDHGFPRNVFSRRRYGGVEAVLLMLAGQRRGFASCIWGTRQEWEALDGTIKEGPGTDIVVGGESLHTLAVYNLCQICGDFPVSRTERPTVDYALVERVVANTEADIRYSDQMVAEYHVPKPGKDSDYIVIARKQHFERSPGGAPRFY